VQHPSHGKNPRANSARVELLRDVTMATGCDGLQLAGSRRGVHEERAMITKIEHHGIAVAFLHPKSLRNVDGALLGIEAVG
jgi:hypothetical protein